MRHGSLFSGIGGFDYAAQQMGWENVFHCEWNEFGQNVLKYYWPEAISYADITKTDFTIHRGSIDVITGGFPCQPYSSAGKRLGKEDDRHLWPEMLRAIQEISPRWVVGENVRGLTNWNGGLVFDEVQADLESQGYEVTPFLLPAVAVNAPHRRDRIWFVAYSASYGSSRASGETSGQAGRQDRHEAEQSIKRGEIQSSTDTTSDRRKRIGKRTPAENREQETGESRELARRFEGLCGTGPTPDTYINERREGGLHEAGSETSERYFGSCYTWENGRAWGNFPTQSPIRTGNDGISTESLRQRIREDCMGHLSEKEIDKIISKALTKWQNESIKAAGNAIVPQVAFQIFKAIQGYETIK